MRGYERAVREYEAKINDPYGYLRCKEDCEGCDNTYCCFWSEYHQEEEDE